MKKKLIIFLLILLLTGCGVKEYTVTLNNDDGSIISTHIVARGSTITNIPNPEKEGYIFVSWLKDGIPYNEKVPVKENLTLTANWTQIPDLSKEYKIIFSYPNKEEEVIVKGKEKVTKPKDPQVKYYSFRGWYDGETPFNFDTLITRDYYLIPKFEKIVLTVKFDLDGGSGITERQIDAGKKLIKPDNPEKFGYTFVGWYLLGKEYNFNSIVEKNMTLVAKWRANEYVTVRFDTDGAGEIKSQVILSGSTVKKPQDPQKEDYIFKYWEYDNLPFDFNTKVEKTLTLTAVYESINEE